MKFQAKIRMQMVMVGLGAALLMAGSTRAQQDMDPTYFDIKPGTPAVSKVMPVRTAQNLPRVTENESAQNALMLASSREATLEAGVARMAIVDAGVALILFGGVVLIVLYARAATRRERSIRVSQVHPPVRPRFCCDGSVKGARRDGDLRESRHTPAAIPGAFFVRR